MTEPVWTVACGRADVMAAALDVMSMLQGRTILITGAGNGIGAAAARVFAAHGARVALVDLDAKVEAVAAGIEGATAAVIDVRDGAALSAFAAGLPALDGAFLNAGIEGIAKATPFEDLPDDTFAKVQAVNVGGMWNGLKAVAPRLKDAGKPDGSAAIVLTAKP